MTATHDDTVAELQRTIGELRRERDTLQAREATLGEVLAARDAALAQRNSEYAERIEQQLATNDVLKAMSATLSDTQPVFDLITVRARELCGSLASMLFEFDGERLHLRSWGGWDPAAAQDYLRQFPMRPDRGTAVGRTTLDRCAVHIRDIDQDPEIAQTVRTMGVRSTLGVPLLRDGQVIGVVAIGLATVGGFSDSQVALLETFAEQAVIAITSAETSRQLQERTATLATRNTEYRERITHQSATIDVLKAMSGSPGDAQPVFDLIATRARDLCDAYGATVFEFDGTLLHWRVTTGVSDDPSVREAVKAMYPMVPTREWHAGRAILDRQISRIDDLATEPGLNPAYRRFTTKSGIAIPLMRGDVAIGALALGSRERGGFTESQIDLFKTFAEEAVIAITSAETYRELQERTAALAQRNSEYGERIEQQAATIDVLKVMAASPGDPQPVFDLIARRARDLCNTPRATLYEFDGELVHLRSRAGTDDAPDALEAYKRLFPMVPTRGSITCRAILDRRIIHVRDLAGEPGVLAAVRNLGHKSQISVPLLRDGAAIGAVAMPSAEIGGFSDSQVALLQTFAEQAVIAITSAETYRALQTRTSDLQETLEYQTATSDVLKVISRSTFDLQPVLNTAAETAARLCAAEQAAIFLREGDMSWLAANFGYPPEYEARVTADGPNRLDPAAPAAGMRAIVEGRIVHIPDAAAVPGYWEVAVTLGKQRTALGVPLMRDGNAIGSIILARQRVEPFTDRQIEIVNTFANQAVIAIENTRLLTEQREALEQQTATAEILRVINLSPGDLTPVFDAIAAAAVPLCDATNCAVFRFDGSLIHLSAQCGLTADQLDTLRNTFPLPPGRGSITARAIMTRQVVHVPDSAADVDLAHPSLIEAGLRGGASVPMLREGVAIGAITVTRQESRSFSDKQIALLENFAAQAVIAMENARLLTETREALEQQTATAEVLQVINGSPGNLTPVFEAILEKAHDLCDIAYGDLQLYDGEHLHSVAQRGLSAGFADRLRQGYRASDSPASRPLLAGSRFTHITDTAAVDSMVFRSAVRLDGIRTVLFVPLRKDGSLLGMITSARREVRPFTEKEISLLENFAAQAVIAMENARLLDEIRQRQAELRTTFDNMGDGVAMFDADLRLAAWNRNFQQIIDLPDALLRERPRYADYMRLLAERGEFGATGIEAELRQRIEDTDKELRLERVRPDGRVIEVRRNAVSGGGFVLIYSDITERKRSEEEIRAARDAAETALRELKTAQANLIQVEKMASLGQLTAGIAHEIKNPLNFVNNFAALSVDLLSELKETAAPGFAALTDDQRAEVEDVSAMLTSNLEKITEHGKRADGIVKAMLEHSRGSSGERRMVDLNALIDEALNLAYHGARAQDQRFNITLERDFGEGIAPIEVNPQDITRVFLNVFANGFYAVTRRAHSDGDAGFVPMLKVTTIDAGEAVEIRVRDNGIGIPADIRDKLFQPFFTTKPTGEGTGLGLSITYDIVTQQHGGSIAVDSKVGDYSEFTVRLPRGILTSERGRA